MRDATLYSMKNKAVQNCRFVHHSKFDCNVTMLYKLFKIDFERGELEKSPFSETRFQNDLKHLKVLI